MRADPAVLRGISGRGNRREHVRSARDVLPQSVQFSVAIDNTAWRHDAALAHGHGDSAADTL